MNYLLIGVVGFIMVILLILTCFCNLNNLNNLNNIKNIQENFKICKVDNDCVIGYKCSNTECVKKI